MNGIYCRADVSLTAEEKRVFAGHLTHQGLSDNVWDLFGEWVARSTPETRFFYLKAYADAELIGLGLFLRIKPFDLRTSYSRLRRHPFPNKLAGLLSRLSSNCVYLSFRNLITSNLTRPFFYRDRGMEDVAMEAILASLRNERDADMVTIIDTTRCDRLYQAAGFHKYPCSSEAYLDVMGYADVSEYLREHRSLRKNLSRSKGNVTTEARQGPVSDVDKEQMRECVECSVGNSRVNNPCQRFFEKNIFETQVFNSNKYVHIVVLVEGRIAGFHVFQVCGSHMGGVLGGFNREASKNHFVYERVIVASLEYAINHGIQRVHYSLVDNHTKRRLVQSREPCGVYFFSRSPMKRGMFELTYKFSDVHELHALESGYVQPD